MTTLFEPPVQYQDTRQYAFQNPRARSGLAGLGDWASDLIESITGTGIQRSAQQQAVALAKVQAESEAAATAARSASVAKYLPWVAASLAVAAVGVAFVVKGK